MPEAFGLLSTATSVAHRIGVYVDSRAVAITLLRVGGDPRYKDLRGCEVSIAERICLLAGEASHGRTGERFRWTNAAPFGYGKVG